MKLWSLNKIMRAVNLLRDGVPMAEIAAKINVTETDLREHLDELKKYGLERL